MLLFFFDLLLFLLSLPPELVYEASFVELILTESLLVLVQIVFSALITSWSRAVREEGVLNWLRLIDILRVEQAIHWTINMGLFLILRMVAAHILKL